MPLEDISSIIIENLQTSISGKLLSDLAESGISLFTCNDKHTPNGVLAPFMCHSRQLAVARLQLEISEPFKKRLWKSLVVGKILNQARCLDLAEKEGAKTLRSVSESVLSGDSDNREAYAAKLYFEFLFGNQFKRGDEDCINAYLNYGYAIYRGIIARHLSSHGLIPCFGIFHRSTQNPFNLADDLIEPFRPIIDLYVATKMSGSELTPDKKRELVSTLNLLTRVKKQLLAVEFAVIKTVQSFVRACEKKDYDLIELPELVALNHKAEE
ncbi:MAG: CRISP-associated protein Cas1 [Clostridiales bacterium]|nr:CRISP-associated protein Cas1 [Clostridiales bacterium]MDN5281604.1 CRISP-associated protein Cas1 [Candidatus Ozemobacter sp.]